MADVYSGSGTITAVTAAPGDTCLGLNSSPLLRATIHLIVLAVGGTPVADNVLQWLIRRFTAAGAGTLIVPEPLEGNGPLGQLAAHQNYTVEPTYATVPLFNLAVHQRSLYQWHAAPGREIKLANITGNGVGVTPIHASYAGSAQSTFHWTE